MFNMGDIVRNNYDTKCELFKIISTTFLKLDDPRKYVVAISINPSQWIPGELVLCTDNLKLITDMPVLSIGDLLRYNEHCEGEAVETNSYYTRIKEARFAPIKRVY